MSSTHTFVKDIEPGRPVEGVYLVRDPILRSTQRGDLYIAMFLCDRTGQANGRVWQATEALYRRLPNPGFVQVRGRSELYQNRLQIVVNAVEPVAPEAVRLDDYLARTEQDTGRLFQEVLEICQEIRHGQVKALVEAFLADEALMERFCTCPAAVKMHHAYLGGLLEHTHNMLRVARAVLPFYPEVQADLVLAGILLHDIGKTEELSYELAFAYTDSGQLIGHITKAVLMVHQRAEALRQQGTVVDDQVVDSLCHIILAHHGQYEFGSPKLPATPEAFMVAYLDDLDAKLNQVQGAIADAPDPDTWTAWQGALQTRLYRSRLP